MILPIRQLQFDFRRIFGITMDYMARYPNQDFQQNVSFKCTMEFRYALKLAMEKARSRDLSSFIRQHLDPAIKSLLDPLTIAELDDLNSPVKIKEAARSHYRKTGCRRVVSAIRLLLSSALPSLERRVIEIARAIRAYDDAARAIEEDTSQQVLLRAAMSSLLTDLGKLLKLLDKGWNTETFRTAISIAAELPEDLSLDISHGLDFLNDPNPAVDKPYAVPPRLDPESAWQHVREEFARDRPLEAALITSLSFLEFDGSTLRIGIPHEKAEREIFFKTPRNRETLALIIESYFGSLVTPKFEILPPT
jgi:hypothetical protein